MGASGGFSGLSGTAPRSSIPALLFAPAGTNCAVIISRTLCLLTLVLLSLAATGCSLYHPPIFQPGNINQQRLRATIHDPYPDPDLGPKDGGSARPRDYQEPLPEPVRNRLFVDSWWWR